jgi:hypothetical protein
LNAPLAIEAIGFGADLRAGGRSPVYVFHNVFSDGVSEAPIRSTHRPVTLVFPHGTHHHETFYYRGGDIYREPEWMEGERRTLTAHFKEARANYLEMKHEYDEVCRELAEAEGYTGHLAEGMGDESRITTDNAEIRKEIEDLVHQIEIVTAQMKALTDETHHVDIGMLEKELASFGPEMEALSFELEVTRQQCLDNEREAAGLITSVESKNALDSFLERKIAQQARNDISAYLHKSMDTQPSCENSLRTASVNAVRDNTIRRLRENLTEANLENTELQLQKQLARTHRRLITKGMLERCRK